eukprot:scaffold319218_cov33-Tisochrysis_lutea.AAC.4
MGSHRHMARRTAFPPSTDRGITWWPPFVHIQSPKTPLAINRSQVRGVRQVSRRHAHASGVRLLGGDCPGGRHARPQARVGRRLHARWRLVCPSAPSSAFALPFV